MNKSLVAALGLASTALFVAASSSAHVSIASGGAIANVTQEVSFGVGHGCELPGGGTADTVKIVIDIPAGVTSVRPMPNPFGRVSVTSTTVTYEKAPADVLPADSAYYKLAVRLKPPNTPFTRVHFPVHQYCNGVAQPVDWVGLPTDDAGAEPAAELVVLPARQPGWNKYTVPADMPATSFPVFFKDALIVWKGSAAWSINPATVTQIAAEPGTSALAELKANDEIWVRY